MKVYRIKRIFAAVLACVLLLSTLCVFPVFAGDATIVADGRLTEIVFGEIFTDADKGNTFSGNLYLEKGLGPVYFDGVRNGDWF